MRCELAVAILILSSQLEPAKAVCPAPFATEAGRCVLINRLQAYSWCEANLQCEALGGELINSYSSLKLLADMPSFQCADTSKSCGVWLGVTDLAEERGANRSGWQLGNRNGVLPLNDSLWFPDTPSSKSSDQDCLSTSGFSTELIDLKCSALRGFACEFVGAAARSSTVRATWRRVQFRRSDFNPSSEYCYADVRRVLSPIHCLAAATKAGKSKDLLYNSKLRTCRLLLFSDAQVQEQIETSADWVKFSAY